MKKVIGFDLDSTLTPSKAPLPDKMSELLNQLLMKFQVCVMSGGKFEQFQEQLLSNTILKSSLFKNLHLMPTSGTKYYRFDSQKNNWYQVYAENLTEPEKQKIIKVLNETIDELSFREKNTYGEIIEDRGSQITLSVLGQDIVARLGEEGISLKKAWDPDSKKKNLIRDHAALKLKEFQVRVGGETSIDITRPGIDKAYGIKKLMDAIGVNKSDILFIGDRLQEGGNDYPVKAMGVDSIEVSSWQETTKVIETIIYLS
jgi:HAD superfamily hydrolase (TIGR01484 family)